MQHSSRFSNDFTTKERHARGSTVTRTKRKRHSTTSNEDDGSDRDSEQTSGKNHDIVSPNVRTLACPFYKLAPREHQRCARLVLSKISYVKQHLIRQHSAGIYCARCYETFTKIDDLEAHQRLPKPCKVTPQKEISGITSSQKEWLSRRSDQSLTEEGKWFAIWDFLFQNLARPVSAYVDLDLPEEVNWLRDYVVSKGPERLGGYIPNKDYDAVAELLGGIVEEWKIGWREGNVPGIPGVGNI
ncbi:hypothetical protein GGS26DRAFT_507586 [Hypomontagnella submonticulosa]|nr:hypothetical protein GGS26DRAFT_507586 [Hypomontagnella submonticulosa]